MPRRCSTFFFHRIVCHFCQAVFYICCHCYRGQRYCRSRCREKARRLQRREANRRYAHSLGLEGREDHRVRQALYRHGLKARVTDQSSLGPSACANLTAPSASGSIEVPPARELRPSPNAELPAGWVVCQICGRQGGSG